MGKNSNALIEGQQAGQRDVAAGANPYDLGTDEYAEWERGRQAASVAKLRPMRCRYADRACDCGGRGLCLDVA